MTYNLFIDDIRNPDWRECVLSGCDQSLDWVIARSSEAAKAIVMEKGMPTRMALDHDLGLAPNGSFDDTMIFLKWLANEYWDGASAIPSKISYHTANPIGQQRMMTFMKSWKKSLNI